MDPTFKIRIAEQGWISDSPEAARTDLCSHGKIDLTIGGQRIIRADDPEDKDPRPFGISESALALLRTLESDNSEANPVAERLICHGCGLILMTGCPIGVNWSVKHKKDHVLINDVMHYLNTSEEYAIRYPDLNTYLPFEYYRKEIVLFAKMAKDFFDRGPKKVFTPALEMGDLDDKGSKKIFLGMGREFDERQYKDFWKEYNQILKRQNY